VNEQPQFDEAAATEVSSFGEVSHALSRVATCICFFFIIFSLFTLILIALLNAYVLLLQFVT